MRAVVQRVDEASVEVDGQVVGQIQRGLLIYLGVVKGDSEADGRYLVDKISHLRIFADADDKMNLDVQQVGGAVLLVSQFTLAGDCRKGRRPGFDQSAEPDEAEALYEQIIADMRKQGMDVQTGTFSAQMNIRSINDGPVTFLLDSKKLF